MSGYISLLLVKVKRWNILVPYFHNNIFVGLTPIRNKGIHISDEIGLEIKLERLALRGIIENIIPQYIWQLILPRNDNIIARFFKYDDFSLRDHS